MYPDRLEYKKDPFRGFDGRCRLLSAFLLIAAVVRAAGFFTLGGVIGGCFLILIREARVTARRLAPVNLMTAALWLPVAAGFDPYTALRYTLRINCAALLSMCLVFPMGISPFAAALAGLKVPRKLIALFLLTCRYIFLLYERLFTALASMGLRRTIHNDVYRWRSISAVFASVLTSAFVRGEKTRAAMVCRGFDGTFPVTAVLKWKFRDTLLLAACAAFSAWVVLSGLF
ncbi:MAG: energy-coupling factor transporter transmembrane protein EcfT [Treponema sp.]|jgi:energy-coupling factor transporter transmembrane protein EcfT|nr:energy-coupling factor transporter transmembrane protein EcfT [Treponema sp.]